MGTDILKYSDRERWLHIVESLYPSISSIFAHPDYMRLYSKEDSLRLFTKIQGNSCYVYPFIERPIPNFENYVDVSSTYGYGGPLMVNPSEEFVCDALNEVREYLVGKKTVAELIKLNPLFVDQNRLFCDKYYGSYEVMRKVVSVPVVKGASRLLLEEYKQKNRKAVRRAIKAGVTIEITRKQETWEKFLELYRKTMEHNRADQKYQIGNEFANNIKVNLGKHYVLVAAKYEKHIISVLLVLYDRVNAYCHLIGTEDKIELRKLQANNLLHHSACEWAYSQGLSELMIGGGRTNNDSDSLLRFKGSFAKDRKEFIACEAVFDSKIYAEIMESRNHRSRGQDLLFYRDSLV